MNAAKMSRLEKEKSPERYCPRCLWNVARSGPCPTHMTNGGDGKTIPATPDVAGEWTPAPFPELKNYRVTLRNIFRDHPRAMIELEAVDPDDARDAAIEQHSMLTGFSETDYAAIVTEITP